MSGAAGFRADRAGMTLVELLVSLGLFTAVLVAAVSALQQETGMFHRGNSRLELVQNYRFAVNMLEQDLQQAGAGVAPAQPPLVYAGASVVSFNADYATRTPGAIDAVFYDPGATAAEVMALSAVNPITVPTTAFRYPDTTYTLSGSNSPAETITFFFAPDDGTPRDDDFALYRQVNGSDPELLSLNILRFEDRPFFEYTRLVISDTAADAMEPVPPGWLPLSHPVPGHALPADTGEAGRIDWIRALRVNLAVTEGRGGADAVEEVSRLIWLRNVRQQVVQTCGDEPLGVARPTATVVLDPHGEAEVWVQWNRSPDDQVGEGDVVRYLLWRRTGTTGWGDPYLSIPAGQPSYTYVDRSVTPGEAYQYAVSAQDCTPSQSERSLPAGVSVPSS